MKNITNLKDLKSFIKTPEAFEGEFTFKGFGIWWNDCEAKGVQGTDDGYFRCDPFLDKHDKDYHRLSDFNFGGFEWVLS
jgi:hypothetical protein